MTISAKQIVITARKIVFRFPKEGRFDFIFSWSKEIKNVIRVASKEDEQIEKEIKRLQVEYKNIKIK